MSSTVPCRNVIRNSVDTQRWLFHRALNAVDEFVVVSEDLRRWLSEELHVRQPITVVPCLLPTAGERTAKHFKRYCASA